MNEASDQDLDDSMDRFEAASEARPITLPSIELRRILLAPDGSNQDPLAHSLAERFDAPVQTANLAEDTPPYRQILEQCRMAEADLLIVPAPFREDFEELGASSIGTNLDLLLHHRETPILVVRDPDRDPEALLREIVIPLSLVAADDIRAAAWAFRLLAPGGRIRLLAVVDTGRMIRNQKITEKSLELEDLDASDLAGLDQPEMAGLVAAVQRHAAETDYGCRVSIRVGPSVQAAAEFANDFPCLVVATCLPDPETTGAQDVHALARLSRNPVLVV